MALTFSISLSMQACTILLGVKKYNEWQREHPDDEDKNNDAKIFLHSDLQHFITHSRTLRRNGLIEDKGWVLTRKGEIMCDLLMIELGEANKTLKMLNSKPIKRLAKRNAKDNN